jgi:hypothetical protein
VARIAWVPSVKDLTLPGWRALAAMAMFREQLVTGLKTQLQTHLGSLSSLGSLAHLRWHLQLNLHDVSQAALAAAVIVLGVVILLELRSVVKLRSSVDRSLARVFEQLDLLRFESQQLLEAHLQSQPPAQQSRESQPGPQSVTPARAVSPTGSTAPVLTEALRAATIVSPATPATGEGYHGAATLAARGLTAQELIERCGLATGEARLLASLAEARARSLRTKAG